MKLNSEAGAPLLLTDEMVQGFDIRNVSYLPPKLNLVNTVHKSNDKILSPDKSQQKADNPELDLLLTMSAKDLWKEGKLERLKELDFEAFKLKYKEISGLEYSLNDTVVKNIKTHPGELNALSDLSGEQLWKEGKFERLKELDFELFKIKYKEFFNRDYSSQH